jgi:hypothetical protein
MICTTHGSWNGIRQYNYTLILQSTFLSYYQSHLKYAEKLIMRGLVSILPRILCQQQRKAACLSGWRLRLDYNPIILFQWERFLFCLV